MTIDGHIAAASLMAGLIAAVGAQESRRPAVETAAGRSEPADTGSTASPPEDSSRGSQALVPVAAQEPILGAFGFVLGQQMDEAALRARNFVVDNDERSRWRRPHEDGAVYIFVGDPTGARRIVEISHRREIRGPDFEATHRRCLDLRAAEMRRLAAQYPMLERWSWTRQYGTNTEASEYLSLRRPRARYIEVECESWRNEQASPAGQSQYRPSLLTIYYSDPRLFRDELRRRQQARATAEPRAPSPPTTAASTEPSGAIDFEAAGRRAADGFDYFTAHLFLEIAIAECVRDAESDSARRHRCADLRLVAARNELLAGWYSNAEASARQSLDAHQETGHTAPASIGRILIVLAEALMAQGKYPEAVAEARRAVSLLLDSEGGENSLSGRAHRVLASTLFRSGALDEAERHARRAIAILRPEISARSEIYLDQALSASTLGVILASRGNWREAARWHRLAIDRIHFGALLNLREIAPAIPIVYAAYGDMLMRRGRPAEAERFYRHALTANRMMSRGISSAHAVNESYHRLGLSLAAQGKREQAEAELRRAVGNGHYGALDFAEFAPQRLSLATLWTDAGAHPRQAYLHFDQAIRAVLSRSLAGGPVDDWARQTLVEHRRAFVGQVRAAWAAAHIPPSPVAPERIHDTPESLAWRQRVANDTCADWTPFHSDDVHADCFAAALMASRHLLAAGNSAMAEAYARRAAEIGEILDLAENGAVPESSDLSRLTIGGLEYPRPPAATQLAATLEAQGKLREAEPLRRMALAEWTLARGEIHSDTADALRALIDNLAMQGKTIEAETLARRAVSLLLDLYGETHPSTADAYEQLAALLRPRDSEAADAAARRATTIRDRLTGLPSERPQ